MNKRSGLAAVLLSLLILTANVALTPELALQSAARAAEPVLLKAYTVFPKTDHSNGPYLEFLAAVAERSKGSIKVEFVGGPEAIPPFQALTPLSKGVIHLAFMPGVYYAGQIPEAQVDMFVQGPVDEVFRTSGVEALLNEIWQKKGNVRSLSWLWMGEPFLVVGNVKLQRADFTGLKVRSLAALNQWIKTLGGTPVTIPAGERYTSLQKGLMDLTFAPLSSIRNERLYEVSRYLIYPSFWDVRDPVLINLDAWNRLSPDLQKLVQDTAREYEKKALEVASKAAAEAEKFLLQKLERVDLPAEEAKKYLKTLDESAWAFVIQQSPQNGPRLRQLLGR